MENSKTVAKNQKKKNTAKKKNQRKALSIELSPRSPPSPQSPVISPSLSSSGISSMISPVSDGESVCLGADETMERSSSLSASPISLSQGTSGKKFFDLPLDLQRVIIFDYINDCVSINSFDSAILNKALRPSLLRLLNLSHDYQYSVNSREKLFTYGITMDKIKLPLPQKPCRDRKEDEAREADGNEEDDDNSISSVPTSSPVNHKSPQTASCHCKYETNLLKWVILRGIYIKRFSMDLLSPSLSLSLIATLAPISLYSFAYHKNLIFNSHKLEQEGGQVTLSPNMGVGVSPSGNASAPSFSSSVSSSTLLSQHDATYPSSSQSFFTSSPKFSSPSYTISASTIWDYLSVLETSYIPGLEKILYKVKKSLRELNLTFYGTKLHYHNKNSCKLHQNINSSHYFIYNYLNSNEFFHINSNNIDSDRENQIVNLGYKTQENDSDGNSQQPLKKSNSLKLISSLLLPSIVNQDKKGNFRKRNFEDDDSENRSAKAEECCTCNSSTPSTTTINDYSISAKLIINLLTICSNLKSLTISSYKLCERCFDPFEWSDLVRNNIYEKRKLFNYLPTSSYSYNSPHSTSSSPLASSPASPGSPNSNSAGSFDRKYLDSLPLTNHCNLESLTINTLRMVDSPLPFILLHCPNLLNLNLQCSHVSLTSTPLNSSLLTAASFSTSISSSLTLSSTNSTLSSSSLTSNILENLTEGNVTLPSPSDRQDPNAQSQPQSSGLNNESSLLLNPYSFLFKMPQSAYFSSYLSQVSFLTNLIKFLNTTDAASGSASSSSPGPSSSSVNILNQIKQIFQSNLPITPEILTILIVQNKLTNLSLHLKKYLTETDLKLMKNKYKAHFHRFRILDAFFLNTYSIPE